MSIAFTSKALDQIRIKQKSGKFLVLDYISHQGCCSVLEEFNLYWMAEKEILKTEKFLPFQTEEEERVYVNRDIVPILNRTRFLLDTGWMGSLRVAEPSKALMKEIL